MVLTRSTSLAASAAWISAFAVLTAVGARVEIPHFPVPYTLQTFVVLVAGAVLGMRNGAFSQLAYLAAGAIGLPVFAHVPDGTYAFMSLLGPTGGYLLAYPAAAWVAGALNRRASSLTSRWGAGVAGIVVIFFGGLAQLTLLTGSVGRAVQLGITPFAALDIVKAFFTALISGSRIARRGV